MFTVSKLELHAEARRVARRVLNGKLDENAGPRVLMEIIFRNHEAELLTACEETFQSQLEHLAQLDMEQPD